MREIFLAPRRDGAAKTSCVASLRRCVRRIVLAALDVILAHHTMTSILLFGLLAAAANVLGGLVLIKSGAHRLGERFLKYLVALGAGFMLAAIFIEILPTTIEIWTISSQGKSDAVAGAMTLLLAGYLSIQFFEHTLAPHFHFGAETHPESFMRPSAAYTAV